jgi:hypothetical protein
MAIVQDAAQSLPSVDVEMGNARLTDGRLWQWV